MRVEGNRAHPEAVAAQSQKVDKGSTEAARQADRKPGVADRVAVSSDAALASAAVKAAGATPDIRPDVVTRMRSLIASGELGADAGRLADSLIDAMLGQK